MKSKSKEIPFQRHLTNIVSEIILKYPKNNNILDVCTEKERYVIESFSSLSECPQHEKRQLYWKSKEFAVKNDPYFGAGALIVF